MTVETYGYESNRFVSFITDGVLHNIPNLVYYIYFMSDVCYQCPK